MCLCIYIVPILIFIDNLHGRQQVRAVDNLTHEPYQHTGIHGVFQGVYESREQVYDRLVNDTYILVSQLY